MMLVRYAFGVFALSGCGLISSNATTYDLDLPAKSFSVDTSGWQLTASATNEYLAKSCASQPGLCATAASAACPMNCTGTCDSVAKTCDLGLEVAVHQTIDLLSEKPELKSLGAATTIIHVTVDSMDYEVVNNSLDVDTPELSVYLAPMSVMDPHDPLSKQIGTIAVVPAGTTLTSTPMMFTDTGQATLTATLANFKSPFNVIVGGTLLLGHGDELPRGKLDANVHIKAHASP
jgi:hypothetical protein